MIALARWVSEMMLAASWVRETVAVDCMTKVEVCSPAKVSMGSCQDYGLALAGSPRRYKVAAKRTSFYEMQC